MRNIFLAILLIQSCFVFTQHRPVDLYSIPSKDSTNNTTSCYTEKAFSISPSKKVFFSPGNLQYHSTNNVWRFAETQTDYIACTNKHTGWRDLFCWGTGVEPGGTYYQVFVDWGINKIGTDAPNTWRTLSSGEWEYLLEQRPNHSILYGVAQVDGVNGLILLPDDWVCPSDVAFKPGCSNFGTKYDRNSYSNYQTFTTSQWSILESTGAIFLPAAGSSYKSNAYYVQELGFYWSATSGSENEFAPCFELASDLVRMFNYNARTRGFSVRLVKDL